LGRFAIGLSSTFTNPLSYTPVAGTDALVPGAEVRIRAGIQGPLGRRTYLRTAIMYAAQQQAKVGTQSQNGVGNRWIAYVSANHGIGPGTATLFAFDVFRSDPQLVEGLTGAAILPRGNLLSLGGRYDWRLNLKTTLSPRVEYRVSTAAPSETDTRLLLAGNSFRYGVDFKLQIVRSLTAALQVDGLSGFVVQAGDHISFNGYRASLHAEWRP
jgi:hypothetical protein